MTNIVYPIIDVALLVALAALVSAGRARLVLADVLLVGLGHRGSVVVDVAYFVLLAEGLWRPGTLLAALSLRLHRRARGRRTDRGHGPETGPRRLLGELPAPTSGPGPAVPAAFVGHLAARPDRVQPRRGVRR